MKLSKRFSLLKKSLGLTLAASCMLTFAACKNMATLPGTSSSILGVKTLDAPAELKASNGGKRKISLKWNVVSVAKYYRIYCSDSPNGTFTQVGESIGASYDDVVASGRTYYYKVSAVNGKGAESSQSEIVKGTSLATPIISNITEEDTCATVEWYTENASSYEDISCFEVHCTDGTQDYSMVVSGDQESYTFYNLSANTSYQFYVELYTTKDPNDVEKSATVTAITFAQYTPVAPEFSASQGDSTTGVKLNITLPSRVQVALESTGGTVEIIDSPLYFEVYRKRASENSYPSTPLIKKLYFDGTTSGTHAYDAYTAGNIMSYVDTSVTRGVKYEYQIKSYIDLEFPDLVSKNYNKVLGSKTGKSAPGWAAAIPSFEIVNYKRVKSDNDTPNIASDDFISSISVQFDASWDDMGKASVYRYAVKEKFTKENDTSVTSETWISDASGNTFLSNLDVINNITKTFDLTQNASEKLGSYDYVLYIIPEADPDGNAYTAPTDDTTKILTYASATSSVTVSNRVDMPSTTFTSYKGGWTNKTQLKWGLEEDVQYSLKRGKDHEDKANWITIPWSTISQTISDDGSFEDTSVEGGHIYTYELYANGSHNTGISVDVKTLGTPAPVFNSYDYDKIKITWNDNAVQCAAYYEVTLGDAQTVGNGASAKFIVTATNKVEMEGSNFDADTTASIEAGEISLTITNPTNYDDATISGLASNLKIKAYSDLESTDEERTATGNKNVCTLGPAGITTTATVAESDTEIVVTWNKVDGAGAYLVRRDRMDSSNKTIVLSDSYIVPENGGDIQAGYVTVATNTEGKLVLTDTSKANDESGAWERNQERLAWGYPYRYTIFPLLKNDDSTDVSDTHTVISKKVDSTETATEVAYKNETQLSATGSTNGYGVNVLATKSQDPHKVKITWTAPYSTEGNNPHLWRSADGVTWTKQNITASDNCFIVTPTGDDRTNAFYYAVSYSSDSPNTPPHTAYTTEISADKDAAYSPLEAKNLGYPFALKASAANVPSGTHAGFSEIFSYELWDYTKRRIGPALDAEYTVSVKNNNFGDGYNLVATIDKLKVIKNADISGYEIEAPTKTGSGKASQTITLTPSNVATNDSAYNTGLLSVLRDYKHYYKLGVSRNRSETETAFNAEGGGTIEASWCDADGTTDIEPLYTYRNITSAELARAAMLAMTYGFFKASGGQSDYSNMGSCYVKQKGEDTAGGKFSNTDGTLGGITRSGKYHHTFKIIKSGEQGYVPAMLTPAGTQNSVVSIYTSSENNKFWRKGIDQGFHCFEGQPVLNVSAAKSEVGNIYDATITITCGGKDEGVVLGVATSISSGNADLKIEVARTYNSSSWSYLADTQAERREYFPIQFADDRNWDFKNSSYGWWGKKQ